MTINQLIQANTHISILDKEILLGYILKKNRTYIIVNKDEIVTEETNKYFTKLLKRREQNEPIAYIIGTKEFYGREFIVNRNVLIPRPETEELIDIVKQQITDKTLHIADIGTGSGCIAITLFEEGYENITAIDISEKTISTALQNQKKYNSNIKFLKGNLLDPIKGKIIDVIVSNLPYVPEIEKKNLIKDVKNYEPHLALFGDLDGTKYYKELITHIKKHPKLKYAFFEVDHSHAINLKNIYQEKLPNFSWKIKVDLSEKNRFIIGKAT